MPIAKVDEERRLVSGFATLDNIDTSDDVVLASASVGAFNRFRGNIREMHEPIAAGRLVDFREDSFYDSKTEKFYRGIYVTVYVSKGAESTWLKVLDGTLSGFSIGGNIIEAEAEFVKDAGDNGKVIRFIKEYDLVELSLVDNPANQLANVFSIQKNASGETFMKGMVTETHILNVFWCPTDEISRNSSNESENCLTCGNPMETIGWYEQGEDDAEKMKSIVTKFLRQKEGDDAITKQKTTGEGGVEMADEVTKSAEEVTEDVVTTDDVAAPVDEAPVEDAAEEVEKAEEVDEAPAEPDFEKMFDNLRDSVHETLEKNKADVAEAVKSVESHVAEVTKAFDEKASELEKGISELRDSLDSIKQERDDVAKRLDALESATAIKKSGEVESDPDKKLQKGSFWGQHFFDGE